MSEITAQERAAWQAACAAATPGPWVRTIHPHEGEIYIGRAGSPAWIAHFGDMETCHKQEFADIEFIAIARDALPRLLAALTAAEQARDAARAELRTTDAILTERNRVLDACPPCPTHGPCVPYAVEWIQARRADWIDRDDLTPPGPPDVVHLRAVARKQAPIPSRLWLSRQLHQYADLLEAAAFAREQATQPPLPTPPDPDAPQQLGLLEDGP